MKSTRNHLTDKDSTQPCMVTLIKTETTQMDKTIVETKMINLIIVWLGIMFASYHFIAYPFYSITTRILQLKSIWDNVIYNENKTWHCNFEIKNYLYFILLCPQY